MWFKYSVIILLFFTLFLLEDSFLPFLGAMGAMLNPVFILFFILIFFDDNLNIFLTIVTAGFLLDLALPSYFGISIISLFVVFFLQKLIDYFFRKDDDKYLIFYFIITFSINFIFYNLLLYLSLMVFSIESNLISNLTIGLIYNLIIACIGFYIYKLFVKEARNKNQLKLI